MAQRSLCTRFSYECDYFKINYKIFNIGLDKQQLPNRQIYVLSDITHDNIIVQDYYHLGKAMNVLIQKLSTLKHSGVKAVLQQQVEKLVFILSKGG